MSDDPSTIVDLVLACRRIRHFVAGVDEAGFRADQEKHWAVVSQLLIIGEAVTRLSKEFRTAHAEIPWRRVAGMRNRLIHEYDKINWTLIWKTVQTQVPALQATLERCIDPNASAP